MILETDKRPPNKITIREFLGIPEHELRPRYVDGRSGFIYNGSYYVVPRFKVRSPLYTPPRDCLTVMNVKNHFMCDLHMDNLVEPVEFTFKVKGATDQSC